MCIIYISIDDFVNNVLFVISPSLFGNNYKYVNGFINNKNEFLNRKNYVLLIYKF